MLSLETFWRDYKFTVMRLLSLTNWFYIQIAIIHDNISSQVNDKKKQSFGQWMNTSIIHDDICSLVHEKSHLKSYLSDTKYHMTPNIIYQNKHYWGAIKYARLSKFGHLGMKAEWMRKYNVKWLDFHFYFNYNIKDIQICWCLYTTKDFTFSENLLDQV